MMIFKNLFDTINFASNFNFTNIARVRRAKFIEAGFDANSVNWDLYAKVLEAKHEKNRRA